MAEGRRSIVEPGDTIEGRYKIIKALDQGGMGTIYLAEHVLIKRRVAMKVLRPEFATDQEVVERFMNEARAAGTLGHPNIVESTDMGFTRDGIPYIVFEYLEGTLLVDEVYRLQGLPVRRMLRIANQIASALHAAHNAGIVHRDLKSENIFLIEREERLDHVKVLDFGISRFLEAETDSAQRGLVMGTPEFMAPEQVTNPDKVDRRADIYALGVIMYEMLSARRPFRKDHDPQAVLHQVVHDPPPPLVVRDAPPGLVEVITEKLLAKDPIHRYQSMKDLQGAIEAFYNIHRPSMSMTPLSVPIPVVPAEAAEALAKTVGATPAPAPAPAPKPQAKRRGARWLWLAAALAAAGAGVAFQLKGGTPPPAEAPAPATSMSALQGDVDRLASAIDGEVRAAHLRAQSIAGSPVLRAGIETDAATVRDLATNEHLFTPDKGEVLEIFQIADGTLHPVVHLPAQARPMAPVDNDGTRLDTDGHDLTVVVSAPITKQDGTPGGAVALATKVDLGPIAKSLAGHALAVTLVGLDQPMALATSDKPGTAVMLPVPVNKDIKPWPLSLQAVISPATPGGVKSASTDGMFSYGFFGIGGVLLVLYVGTLMRGRREG